MDNNHTGREGCSSWRCGQEGRRKAPEGGQFVGVGSMGDGIKGGWGMGGSKVGGQKGRGSEGGRRNVSKEWFWLDTSPSVAIRN